MIPPVVPVAAVGLSGYMVNAMNSKEGVDSALTTHRPPFAYLLAALLASAAVYPVGGRGLIRFLLSESALLAILVTGVLIVGRGPVARAVILAFGVMFVVGGFALVVVDSRWLAVVRGLSGAVFVGVITVLVLREVLRDERVTGDKITGSICGYLLMGTCWSIAYALIELASPGSFVLTETSASGGEALRSMASELTYFSYVTLTTLGYGDVAPISPLARTLAWMEAGAGQIYLTVLVARLVGLHIAHSREGDTSRG